MSGQGSPKNHDHRSRKFLLRKDVSRPTDWVVSFALSLIFIFFLGNEQSTAAQTQPSLNQARLNQASQAQSSYAFRMTWGGGQSRTWHAAISVEGGTVDLIQPLGLDPFVPGSVFREGNLLRLESSSASTFGGIDFTTTASLDASLTIDFFCDEAPDVRFHRVITLRELTEQVLATQLDEDGNRISLQRQPGDELHIETPHSSMVFSRKELFRFSVEPRIDANKIGTSPKLRIQLQTARTGRSVWSTEYTFENDSAGKLKTLDNIEIPLPDEPGIYDLQMTLNNRSIRNWNSPEYRREIQLIVVESDDGNKKGTTLWSEISHFNAADTIRTGDWKQRFTELSNFSTFSSRPATANALGNDKREAVEYENQSMVSLMPGGWMAIPLATTAVGKPHIVEIEYVHEGPMRLGISVLQPDSANQIAHFGTDSGIVVPETAMLPSSLEEQGTRKHRIVFWPRHRTPMLLFANRDQEHRAVVGNIRILAGPDELGSADLADVNSNHRQYLAYLEKPLFTQQFDATRWLEQNSGQLLDDWQTFSEGASRLVQHLKANGYSGMALTVASDGGSLYPGKLLQPTPRYDNGAFWPTGKDLQRKDVLELLFRICDREQLELLPVLELSTPIPELEQQRHVNQPDAEGIDLVDMQGKRIELNIAGRIIAYNPLDPRVQTATLRVIDELAQRYSSHPSFAGLGIKLAPESLLPLQSPRIGLDVRTMERFIADTKLPIEIQQTTDLVETRIEILKNSQAAWIQWRADQTARFLNQMQQTVAKHCKDSRLLLLPIDLSQTNRLRSSMNPSPRNVSNMAMSMVEIGLDVDQIRQNPNIELLQTHRLAFDHELADNRVNIHLNHNAQTDAYFAKAGGSQLFLHRHRWTHFAQLQQSNPFGQQRSELFRIQPLSPSDLWNRQRFADSLFKQDSRIILDGGWLLPTGQNSAIGSSVDTFTRLPNKFFQSVISEGERGVNKTVAVRQLQDGGESWFYVANPNPWRVNCQLKANQQQPLVVLGNRADDLSVDSDGTIKIELAPFEIVGVKVEEAEFQLLSYSATVDDEVIEALRRQLDRLQAKVSRASQTDPWPVLNDASFEGANEDNQLEAWPIDSRNEGLVEIVSVDDAKSGQNVLSLRCTDSPTFIRSHEIPAPPTGRLSITAWVRTTDDNLTPPLNISIDAYHQGRPFYRYASVGNLEKSLADQPNWRQIAVHFDEVPTSELTNLRIGFDLMGPGQVQIDDVQIFDRWFDEQDAASLTQQFAHANFRLKNEGDLNGCREFLQQYWALFFNEYFPDKQPDKTEKPIEKEARLIPSDPENQPILDQIKNAPQRIFQRR